MTSETFGRKMQQKSKGQLKSPHLQHFQDVENASRLRQERHRNLVTIAVSPVDTNQLREKRREVPTEQH